jgi:hypothetical protein
MASLTIAPDGPMPTAQAGALLQLALEQGAAPATAPAAYRGLWRRTLLVSGNGSRDEDTRVFWMQTARLHIDIRVPAGRPSYAGAGSLDELTRDELVGLGEQMGFAGITAVEGGPGLTSQSCTWHRQIDYSVPSEAKDIGAMRFETPNIVLEDGIEAVYHERWEREADSAGIVWALRFSPQQAYAAGLLPSAAVSLEAGGAVPAVFVARCGNRFMLARARSLHAQAALVAQRGRSLAQAVRDPAVGIELARAWLDFEISLGEVCRADGTRWIVSLSTLPWREGQAAFDGRTGAALDALPPSEPLTNTVEEP